MSDDRPTTIHEHLMRHAEDFDALSAALKGDTKDSLGHTNRIVFAMRLMQIKQQAEQNALLRELLELVRSHAETAPEPPADEAEEGSSTPETAEGSPAADTTTRTKKRRPR